MLRTTTILGLALAAVLHAQCPRPAVPPGGFAVDELAAERTTYGDGVVAEGRLLVPIAATPTCGWPLVVYVHSLGSHREQDRAWQDRVASRGFAVWAYDVRGQATTRVLDPTVGTTLYGAVERFDLADQIAFVRGAHAGVVSSDRVAVIGDSQGGIHAWMAAVQSGQDLTLAGRGTVTFPVISCVVGADFVTEPIDHRVRGGTLFSAAFLELCAADPLMQPFLIDQGFASTVLQYFAAQDAVGLDAWMRAQPGRVVEDGMATCTVPILFHHAWHDSICGIGPILDAEQQLPSTTPFRLVASTVGHAVPHNTYELALKRELSERWLERFLWDEPNDVDQEARYVLAWMPVDAQQHGDPGSLWEHVHVEGVPARDSISYRLFTTDAGTLVEEAPQTAGSPTRIEHLVPTGFDAQAWLADPGVRSPAGLMQRIPLSERAFEMTLTRALDLVGAPRMRLQVTPDASKFALIALLSVRLPGSPDDRMLTHWGRGILDATPGVPVVVEFELSPIAARLPIGTVLKLTIRNHWIPEAPHLRGVVATPLFDGFHVDIAHGSGVDASYVELLVLSQPAVSLTAGDVAIEAASPGELPFGIEAGQARAGWRYLIAVSASGHGPGIVLPGGVLPVQLDAMTSAFAAAFGTPELRGFAGTLGPDGMASAALDLRALGSLPVELIGLRLTFAAWVHRSLGDLSGAPSNPVDARIR